MSKKFAFLVHDPIMLVHYKDVWKAIGRSNFLIITSEYFAADNEGNEKLGLASFFKHISDENYEVKKITEVINCGIKYEYVITNHIISGSTKKLTFKLQDYLKKLINRGLAYIGKAALWNFAVDVNTYLPLQVGKKQIRYMYGADISDGWSLQSWNEIYDIFLCHGVNDERELKKRFKGHTFIMGYPRYDRFFSEEIDLDAIRAEFEINSEKKTILWMPTCGGDFSSIPQFAEPLSTLQSKYNFIVRPHPLSFVQEQNYIKLLESFNFKIDRNALRDMNELYGIANVILADNGGSPFSAIFLNKNVIFLDLNESSLDNSSFYGSILADSSVTELKAHLPSITKKEIFMLDQMLESENFYKNNSNSIEMLFKKYFDSPRGGGSHRVAELFKTL